MKKFISILWLVAIIVFFVILESIVNVQIGLNLSELNAWQILAHHLVYMANGGAVYAWIVNKKNKK